MWFFPLAFLLWPLIEIGGFIAVGKAIGVLPTLGAIVLSGVVGAVLLRYEGLRVLRRTFAALQSGKRPDQALAHAALVALGGMLLVLPGFFSDLVGLALFIPPVRAGVIALFAWMTGPTIVVETRVHGGGATVVDLDPDQWRRHEPSPSPSASTGPAALDAPVEADKRDPNA